MAGADERLRENAKKENRTFRPHSLFPEGPSWYFMSVQPDASWRGSIHLKSMLFQQMEMKKKPYAQKPPWRLDCHPLRLHRKCTEIIKPSSRGSMTAHKFRSCHSQGRLSSPLSTSFHPDYGGTLKAHTAVSILNDASITFSAPVTADRNMEQTASI